ncbi:MAG TPA: alpha/beta hydrolase [Rhodanobacteraceae bacterium]
MADAAELHATVPAGELTALHWGDTTQPPLLALHGWLDNAASFSHVAPLLAAHRHVIAVDLPGHGHSAHLPARARRYHIVDQVDTVLDFADALGLQRFDLLGHSLGAGIAALVAAAAPGRVARLVLIEGLGPLADDGTQTLQRWRAAQARSARPARPSRVFASLDDAVAARVAAGGLDADEARPIVRRNLRETAGGFTWRSDRRLRLATPVRIDEPQVRRLLGGITAPTLVLLAEPPTPYLPTATMDARAACVTTIRVQRMPGPHHLHVRHPRTVASQILGFLGECALP